jgi:cytochrome c oxidase subunit 2
MYTLKQAARWAVAACIGLASSAHAETTLQSGSYWNLPTGVTELSREEYGLHMMAFWWCVAIGIVVFGIMFYSLFAFRRSKHPVPATFHESTRIEVLWTIIPFIILIIMAVPAAGTLIKSYDTTKSDMTLRVTGFQWKWYYQYLDQGVAFYSTLDAKSNQAAMLGSGIDPRSVENYLRDVDRPLVVPIHKKIRLLFVGGDVMHGWWVPDVGVKKDLIPGYVNEAWMNIDEPGVYRGQCTVLCGRGHGYMPIVVRAVDEDTFKSWVAQQKAAGLTMTVASAQTTASDAGPAAAAPAASAAPAAAPAEATAASSASAPAAAASGTAVASNASAPAAGSGSPDGAAIYTAKCAQCHQANGKGLPPTFPSLAGDKIVNGPPEGHILQILKGKNVMPPFAPQLSDAEIAAVATYERSSFGNHAPAVQAAQVAALRGK